MKLISLLCTFVMCISCVSKVENRPIVIVNGTIIDLAKEGTSLNDYKDSQVILRDGVIESVGILGSVKIPDDAKVINAEGKFIIPGLIDGFAAINNQSYANAYLYSGVTSIIAVSGGRRGEFFPDGDPTPNIYRLESIGDDKAPIEIILHQIDLLAAIDVKVLLIMYQTLPNQLKAIVNRAKKRGMVTIGELGKVLYVEGIDAGINAFVHTTRYSLNSAPEDMQRAVTDSPFSNELNSPKWTYYKWLSEMSLTNPKFMAQSELFGNSEIALMPTLSLLYLDQVWSRNVWNDPVAKIINPEDVDAPADKSTGKHTYDPAHTKAYFDLAKKVIEIEKANFANGVLHLAGSATDVWGTMPGISLHTELESLARIGMTNRQIIAAATSNFNKAFGWKIGQITPGFSADILILDKNPLEDLKNFSTLSSMFLNGKSIDRKLILK